MLDVTGRSTVRRSNIVMRTLSGTVFEIRLRGKRRVATRVSKGVEVRCVGVLPNSGMEIRVDPCSLSGNHVMFECGWGDGGVGAETSLGGHATSYGVIHHGKHLCIVGGGGPGFGAHRNWCFVTGEGGWMCNGGGYEY